MCAGQNSLWMRTENGTSTQVLTVYHVFHGAVLYSIANGNTSATWLKLVANNVLLAALYNIMQEGKEEEL